jgi:hypothetical protein
MSLETLRPFQQRTNEQDDRKKSSKKTKSARLTTPKDATVVFAAAESDLSSIHTPNTTQETEDQAPASTVRPMPTRPNKLLPTPTNILNTERFSLSPPLLLPAPSPSSGRIGAPYPITRTTPMGSHKTRPLHWSPLVSFSDPMSPHCSVRKKEESSSTSSSTQARAKNTLAMDNKSMPARHDQPEEEIIDFNKEFTSSSGEQSFGCHVPTEHYKFVESPLEAFTLDRSKSEALLTPTGVGTFLLRRRTGHSGANNGNEYLALSLRATGGEC